jgi:hypothetical protein
MGIYLGMLLHPLFVRALFVGLFHFLDRLHPKLIQHYLPDNERGFA